MTIFDKQSSPKPRPITPWQRCTERLAVWRPFLRWVSHFLVSGFVGGAMLVLWICVPFSVSQLAGVSQQLHSQFAVRVVLAPTVTKARADVLIRALADSAKVKGAQTLRYQAIDSAQGRALLGIDDAWMDELPPLSVEQLPIVLELRQLADAPEADLARLAQVAQTVPEAQTIMFNETGWQQARATQSEISQQTLFINRGLCIATVAVIALTNLLSAFGLRHRRLWLLPLGVLIAAGTCWLTLLGAAAGVERLGHTFLVTVPSAQQILDPWIFGWVVVFWVVIETLRLRLRRADKP